MLGLLLLTVAASAVLATPVVYDGRVPSSFPEANLDSSAGPFLTVVKGRESATHYSSVLGHTKRPTPLWNESSVPTEQVISVRIDNTSVFFPGGNNPQFGFRRTELLAQAGKGGPAALLPDIKDGAAPSAKCAFIQSPGPLLDHSLNVLFSAPSSPRSWHNFAVLVDWGNLTLKVYYSKDGVPLTAVTGTIPNLSVSPGGPGKGEFHFGILRLPLVDLNDSPSDQGDVVHHGIQEGSTEALFYSGVFVEKVTEGVSTGYGKTIQPWTSALSLMNLLLRMHLHMTMLPSGHESERSPQ
ncbi:hypothetical protein BDN71DRAFT_1503484 [Pleurotus eryngii]|uniref:Glycoside hydrolase 131 catalytic N-terminal domain-containing protein n=1 Tax=Pleurotus eryngii TaxID=5323 RepID=A0A9P6A307_PLEER|nr:hypothetical protein BDN71DRAFT_1503484 [Pleurotus eryngii]